MSTIYYTATTLDGFIADPDDSLEWLFSQKQDRDGGSMGYESFIAGVGALCMGRTTYDWVRAKLAEDGDAWPYEIPAWVVSHRPADPVEGADVRFASGDVRALHAEMTEAAGGRDLWVTGGGDLAGQFADAGLLDQIVVSVASVTLGAGRPLLPRRITLALRDVERNGDFICARYDVVGALP